MILRPTILHSISCRDAGGQHAYTHVHRGSILWTIAAA